MDSHESSEKQILTFSLRNQIYGLDIKKIETVVRMVEVTEIPGSKKHVLGAINYHGQILPVIDIGVMYGQAKETLKTEDLLIVLQNQNKKFCIVASALSDILTNPGESVNKMDRPYVEDQYFEDIFQNENGMILVTSLEDISRDIDMQMPLIDMDF